MSSGSAFTEAADDPEPTDFGLEAAAALEEVRWEGYAIRVPPLDFSARSRSVEGFMSECE